MPANLPPPILKRKSAQGGEDPGGKSRGPSKRCLTIMPKHKGTDKLRPTFEGASPGTDGSPAEKGPGKHETPTTSTRKGRRRQLLSGPANTGKSSLVAALTNASPEIADFPTRPGNRPGWPPLKTSSSSSSTRRRASEFMDPAWRDLRRTDIIVIMVDIHGDPLQHLDDTVSYLATLRIYPEGAPVPADLKKRPFIKKVLVAVNKVDDEAAEEDYLAFLELCEMPPVACIGISALLGRNLDGFLRKIYELAEVIRVYTKSPGKGPDRKSPFVLPRRSTLEALAAEIHKDFVTRLKFAKSGAGVYDGSWCSAITCSKTGRGEKHI